MKNKEQIENQNQSKMKNQGEKMLKKKIIHLKNRIGFYRERMKG